MISSSVGVWPKCLLLLTRHDLGHRLNLLTRKHDLLPTFDLKVSRNAAVICQLNSPAVRKTSTLLKSLMLIIAVHVHSACSVSNMTNDGEGPLSLTLTPHSAYVTSTHLPCARAFRLSTVAEHSTVCAVTGP